MATKLDPFVEMYHDQWSFTKQQKWDRETANSLSRGGTLPAGQEGMADHMKFLMSGDKDQIFNAQRTLSKNTESKATLKIEPTPAAQKFAADYAKGGASLEKVAEIGNRVAAANAGGGPSTPVKSVSSFNPKHADSLGGSRPTPTGARILPKGNWKGPSASYTPDEIRSRSLGGTGHLWAKSARDLGTSYLNPGSPRANAALIPQQAIERDRVSRERAERVGGYNSAHNRSGYNTFRPVDALARMAGKQMTAAHSSWLHLTGAEDMAQRGSFGGQYSGKELAYQKFNQERAIAAAERGPTARNFAARKGSFKHSIGGGDQMSFEGWTTSPAQSMRPGHGSPIAQQSSFTRAFMQEWQQTFKKAFKEVSKEASPVLSGLRGAVSDYGRRNVAGGQAETGHPVQHESNVGRGSTRTQQRGAAAPRRGMFGNAFGQVRRGMAYRAYQPALAAITLGSGALVGALPEQQEEAKSSIALAGVGYNDAMIRKAIANSRQLAGANLMTSSADHLKSTYETSSGFETTAANQAQVNKVVAFAAKYRLFSQETSSKATQHLVRWTKMFEMHPELNKLSEEDRLMKIGSAAASVIETSTAHGVDISAAFKKGGPIMARAGFSPGNTFGMIGALGDTGIPYPTIGNVMSKFDNKMIESMTRMQFGFGYEQQLRDKGKTGSASYFPFEKERSPYSASTGKSMFKVDGLTGPQFMRQRGAANIKALREGSQEDKMKMLFKYARMVNTLVSEKRWASLRSLKVGEGDWPFWAAMDNPAVQHNIMKFAQRADSGEGENRLNAGADAAAMPRLMAPEFHRLVHGAVGGISGWMEGTGGPQWARGWSDVGYAKSAIGGYSDKISTGDYPGALKDHASALDIFKHMPSQQKELNRQFSSKIEQRLYDDPKQLHQEHFKDAMKATGQVENKLSQNQQFGLGMWRHFEAIGAPAKLFSGVSSAVARWGATSDLLNENQRKWFQNFSPLTTRPMTQTEFENRNDAPTTRRRAPKGIREKISTWLSTTDNMVEEKIDTVGPDGTPWGKSPWAPMHAANRQAGIMSNKGLLPGPAKLPSALDIQNTPEGQSPWDPMHEEARLAGVKSQTKTPPGPHQGGSPIQGAAPVQVNVVVQVDGKNIPSKSKTTIGSPGVAAGGGPKGAKK